jgi:hypothetical protein
MAATPGATDEATPDLCVGRGTADGDHCCYVNGETCRYLADNGLGAERRFECSLRRDLGSWEAVHADPGYQQHVQTCWDALDAREGETIPIHSCGEWQPAPGVCCREER